MQATHSADGAAIEVWDLPLRLFHWLLVAAVATAFLSAFRLSPIAPWHRAAGWVAAVLIAFRIVWGFVGGENARFSAFHFEKLASHLDQLLRGRVEPSLGHNPLGGVAIFGLLGFTAVAVWTGALVQKGAAEDVHEMFAYALLGMIAVHLTAVIAMSRLSRENLVTAMLTGRKSSAVHPDAANARAPAMVAILVGAVTIVVAAYAATILDPLAFSPHPVSDRGESSDGVDGG